MKAPGFMGTLALLLLSCMLIPYFGIFSPLYVQAEGPDLPQELQKLEKEGKLTVRALRAWGQLPEKFMALAFDLRPLGIDLMNADTRTVRDLAREADGNEQLRPLADDLQALAVYMAEFGPTEPEAGNSGNQNLQGQTEINADALVPVAEQEALARDLFTRIGALKDYDLEGMEELYLQVITQAPETRLAHESYWRLSNMYMQAFSQPRNKEAITLLEKYLQRYPNSFVLDEQFALFATPGLPLVQKRLLHLYAQEEMWEKAGDLYARLIPDLDEANQKLLQYFIAYGRALENSDRKEQAISVYQAYLRNVQKPSQTLERAARNRLQALGCTIPESQAQISYDNLHEATLAGNLEEVQRLVAAGAELSVRDKHGRTPLFLALMNEDLELGKMLMTAGAAVDDEFTDGNSFLHLAAGLKKESDNWVKQLIAAGADVSKTNEYGLLAFDVAVRENNARSAELLFSEHADLELVVRDGMTRLHEAILLGRREMAQTLIELGADVKGKDRYGNTLLHLAASKGYTHVVGQLLDHGLNIDAHGARERTALHQAARAGHTDTVHLLINRGADLKARDKQGKSASSLAFARKHEEIVALFRKHGVAVYDNLRKAAVEGEAEDVRLHIQQGANVHGVDDDQNTALHLAAREGHQEVVLVLVESGADVQARNIWNAAPVHYAAGYGHLNVAEFLITHGTPKDLLREEHALNKNGTGALHYAVMNKSIEAAKYLLAAGTQVDAREARDRTPLHLAAMEGDRSLLDLLLKHGAAMDARDDQGLTPLHLAVVHWQPQIVETFMDRGAKPGWEHVGPTLLIKAVEEENISSLEYLLAQGIDINAQNRKGYSALHAAAATGEPSVVDFLLDQGADPNLQDAQGNTPLILAAEDTSNAWDLQSAELLIAHGETEDLQKIGWPELRIAALQGDGQRVKALLKNDPKQLNYDGEQWAWSILHAASRAGHTDVVQLLIESGVDVNEESANRETPVFSAAMAGHREVVELLTAYGADLQQLHFYMGSAIGSSSPDKELVARLVNAGVDLNSLSGPKSLPAVFLARDLDMLEYLIELGADVNQPVFGQPGFTLLARSVEQGDKEKVALLLEHGAEIPPPEDSRDETFLHIAVDRGDMAMVKLLVSHGAAVNAQDIDGITPLHIAVEDNNLPLVTYLLQQGADVSIEDEYGRTPRDKAERARDREMLRALDAKN